MATSIVIVSVYILFYIFYDFVIVIKPQVIF